MLFERHLSAKMRRAGIKNTSTHKKRNLEDNTRLEKNLIKLIIQ